MARIRYDSDIAASEITPEGERFRGVPKSRYSTGEAPTPIEVATTRTRFRELEEDIGKNGEAYTPYPWKVSVEGACAKPRMFDLDDLLSLAPMEERVYRMLCTEGWLHIVPYIGYPLSEILKRVQPTANAKYVDFTSLLDPAQFRGQREITYIDWPYLEGLRIDEAMHPLTLVALGAYGQALPKGLGAPIAIRVPWKFGTKSPKAVVRIRLTEQQPGTPVQRLRGARRVALRRHGPRADVLRVWDLFVRVFHWGLVAAFVVAYLSHGGYLAVHRMSGYAIAALVIARIVWGFAGSPPARFTNFVVAPRELARYVALMLRAREPRHVGHNPAGGAMIVLMLLLLAALCATGIALDTPRYRDDRDLQEVHEMLTDASVVCIVLHLAGVAWASWRHRENLVAAMLTGRKRREEGRS